MDLRFLLLQVCFLVSGFSALLYQTAWTREFAFVFGTSEIAVAVVLAGYMGGLALGSALAARFAPAIRRPVLVYGVLELGIALSALAIPLGMRGLTFAYVAIFGHELPEEPGDVATLFRLAGAFLLMLVPTGFMGATLPLLARHAVRHDEEIGPRIGALYAINTFGAIAGTVCAAFLLLPAVGLRQTVYVGALGNFVVFLLAAALSRRAPPVLARPAGAAGMAHRWILPLMLLSGAVSFSYEVLWTRLLAQLLGGSLYAFATMLSSFLLGIALGSAGGGAIASRPLHAAIGFATAEVGVAVFGIAAFLLADDLPRLGQALGAGWQASPAANAPLAALVLLPVATCLGATFPFAVRLLAPHPSDSAAATARVYAWNTVGAILGAVATGFVLLPALHFAGTAVLGASVSLGIAAIASLRVVPRLFGPLVVAVGCGAFLAVAPIDNPWRLLLAQPLSQASGGERLRYEAAGRSATVVLIEDAASFRLYTNGLPEATVAKYTSTPAIGREARALGLLPSLLRPDARRALVIGLGGGVALEGLPPTISQVDVVELEAEVVEANRVMSQERALDPLADPRTRIVLDDARGALMLASRRYDAIISQPSHPWTAGASHLYTREFFELVRDRLVPDGVLVQWIGLRFVDASLLRSLLATLVEVFPEVQVHLPHGPALLFAASKAPLDIAAAGPALAAARDHFARNGLLTAEDAAAWWVLDTAGSRALAGDAPENTDDRNLLAARSARIDRGHLSLPAFARLVSHLDPLPERVSDFDPSALARSLARRGEFARGQRLAAALEGAERQAALGWVQAELGDRARAARRFDRALELDPTSGEAHAGRVVLELAAPAGPPPPPEAAQVRRALAHEETRDWDALAALDDELARIAPGDPLFETATRLRYRWRLHTGDPERVAEAIPLLDMTIARRPGPDLLLERAWAAHLAGRTTEAWATLDETLDRLPAAQGRGPLLLRIEGLSRRLENDPLEERVAARIARLGQDEGRP